MSKRNYYYNKGNKYKQGYSNNDYNYGYDNDSYNNNYNNNYYNNNNRNNNKNYYHNYKKAKYDFYNYNGMNTKYKEQIDNKNKDDYFQKKFNQEIKNEVFEEKEEPKLIISSNLMEDLKDNLEDINNNGNELNGTNKVNIKENEEKELKDEFYNKYMEIYEKKLDIKDMEQYCEEVNKKEVMKGELKFKEEFQKNKMNNNTFDKRDYEIFKVVHGLDKNGKKTNIIDFSFNKKGVEENNIYLNNPEYFSYFRRGLSLYELNGKLIILRKGLIKFNELPYDFYKIYGKNKYELFYDYKDTEENSLQEKTNFQELLKSIFYPIYKYLSNKNSNGILLYKLLKANGENAQISYSPLIQKWVIASKNVSLICSNLTDLYEHYEPLYKNNKYQIKPTRYNIAFQIALCWFDIIEHKTNKEIDDIKKELSNRTFCGEYCGNQYHEHLIRHSKHTIYFYSIIDNNDENNICIPIEEAFDTFKKLKLDYVNYNYIGIYKNKNELFEGIHKVYKSIAEKSILYEEEGDVLYFVNSNDNKVISLCKVKTLEYKIYRKLREKIKNELKDEEHEFNMNRKKISQFFNEVQLFSQSFKLPNPLEFYFSVSDMAFRFIDFYKNKFIGENPEFDLHTTYLDLIEMIHSIIDYSFNLESRNNSLTSQDLVNNIYMNKKKIQIYIFAPPCYIPEDYFNDLMSNKYNIQMKYKLISFDNMEQNISSINSYKNKDDKINIEITLINYLEEGTFEKINKKLSDNQYIIAFGINSKQFNISKEKFIDRLRNPDFFIYNKNTGLFPYFKNKSNENNMNNLFKTFLNQCYKILFEMKKTFPEKVKIYESYENENNNYLQDFESIINEIKSLINSTEYEKQILKEIEDYVNNNKSNENKENLNYKIDIENIKTNINTNNNHSKYYKSDIICLYSEHENVYMSLLPKFLKYEESQLKSKLENYNKDNTSLAKIVILIPITLPGSGKTEIIKFLQNSADKYGVKFDYISSDDIRKKEIELYMKKMPGITEREAFTKSHNFYNKSFQQEIETKFKNIYLDNKIGHSLLFIDKNHPPNAINKTIEPIRKIISSYTNLNKQVVFIGLIPECINNFIIGPSLFLPFSLSYLIQCYIRVRNRTNHPLMNQNRKDLLLFLMGSFLKNFIGVSLDSDKLMNLYSIDQTYKLPFTDEIDDSQFPEDILVPSGFFIGTLVDSKYDFSVTTSDSENFENKINKYFFNIDSKIPFNDKNEIKYKLKKNIFYPTKELISCKIDLMIKKFFNINSNDSTLNSKINTEEIKLKNFIYVAIIFKGDNTCFKLKPKIFKTLKSILQKFSSFSTKEEKNEIKNLSKSIQIIRGIELPKGWNFPHKMRGNYWHITTLYRGDKSFEEIENHLAYKQYVEDKNIFVTVIGLVYVPEGIMCLLIRLNDGIVCNGEYPHMTIIRNKYPPKYSNLVIKECLKLKELKYQYDKSININQDNMSEISTTKKEDFIQRKQIVIDENKVIVYFVIFEKPFDVKGTMHAFERDDNSNDDND